MIMKIIAHRGNIDGPDPLTENQPETIDKAIELRFDVEIDVRYIPDENKFFLGHDNPDYEIDLEWIINRKENLWIHCKDLESLNFFSSNSKYDLNYFWHQTDSYTLTSERIIWAYPGQEVKERCVIVMPEKDDVLNFLNKEYIDFSDYNCYGICTDYAQKIKL